METNAHRFDKSAFLYWDISRWDYLVPRKHGIFAHHSLALHAKCFIILAGIVSAIATGRAVSAVGVWIQCYRHSGCQILRHALAYCLYHGTYLMAWHNRELHHRIASKIRVEV